jgi:hypothetical protein
MTPQRLFYMAKVGLLTSGYLRLDAVSADAVDPLISGFEEDKEIDEGYRFSYDNKTVTLSAHMPSYIHNCVQFTFADILKNVLRVGFITWPQFKRLTVYCGTRYENFVGIHAGSVKEPDVALDVDGRQSNGCPTTCPVGLMNAPTQTAGPSWGEISTDG